MGLEGLTGSLQRLRGPSIEGSPANNRVDPKVFKLDRDEVFFFRANKLAPSGGEPIDSSSQ